MLELDFVLQLDYEKYDEEHPITPEMKECLKRFRELDKIMMTNLQNGKGRKSIIVYKKEMAELMKKYDQLNEAQNAEFAKYYNAEFEKWKKSR